MLLVEELINEKTKIERQKHLDLNEPCIERGGISTNHKGVLAEYLNTNIPYGVKYPLCHACHNGKCSNPKHLYWGTPKENIEDQRQDMENRGIDWKAPLRKRKPLTDEHKNAISKAQSGRAKSKEHKRKISQTLSNRSEDEVPKGYKRKYKQVWINNGITQTRIREGEEVPGGFELGRL